MQQLLDPSAPPARAERHTILASGPALAAREALLALALFWLYRQTRKWIAGDVDQAMINADRVVDAERAMGVYTELQVQQAVLEHRWLVDFLDHYYVLVHFPITAIVLIWVYRRSSQLYRTIRNYFIVVSGTGLLIHVLFPLAPPRMLAHEGFVDTLDIYGPDIYSNNVANSAANQLAAMPSLHFAWALVIAIAVIAASSSRTSRLAVAHPALTLLAIVATGNHYWLDAAVGAILVMLGVRLCASPHRTDPSPVARSLS
jgi:hypothetical protein